MKITLNGEAFNFVEGSHIQDLVSELGYQGKTIAVEHNKEIIPAADYHPGMI